MCDKDGDRTDIQQRFDFLCTGTQRLFLLLALGSILDLGGTSAVDRQVSAERSIWIKDGARRIVNVEKGTILTTDLMFASQRFAAL